MFQYVAYVTIIHKICHNICHLSITSHNQLIFWPRSTSLARRAGCFVTWPSSQEASGGSTRRSGKTWDDVDLMTAPLEDVTNPPKSSALTWVGYESKIVKIGVNQCPLDHSWWSEHPEVTRRSTAGRSSFCLQSNQLCCPRPSHPLDRIIAGSLPQHASRQDLSDCTLWYMRRS